MAGPTGTLLLPRNKSLQVPIVLANCHPAQPPGLRLVRCVVWPSSLMARYSGMIVTGLKLAESRRYPWPRTISWPRVSVTRAAVGYKLQKYRTDGFMACPWSFRIGSLRNAVSVCTGTVGPSIFAQPLGFTLPSSFLRPMHRYSIPSSRLRHFYSTLFPIPLRKVNFFTHGRAKLSLV